MVETTRPGTPPEKKRYRLHLQVGEPVLTSRRKRVVGVDFGIAHANPTVWARGIAFERANTRWGLTHRRRLRSVPVSGADAPPPTRTSPMSDPDEELRKAVALFRYGLFADVLRLPPGSREIRRTLREKAQRNYTIPGTRRTRVAWETMRDWLSVYRTGGFEALYPKTRADRGQPRRMPPEVAELLVSLKTEQPARSVKALIDAARKRGVDHPLAPSTVHRLLAREGLLDKRPGEPVATDRRRFAFRDAGELWMSDVMHGPKVSDGRRRRKTFLIAFIDDATRVIPFAAFAFAENTTAFLPVFKHAIARRGLPARLYVDNAANFRSQQLAPVCAKLGIALIHARPYQPAGKSKDS